MYRKNNINSLTAICRTIYNSVVGQNLGTAPLVSQVISIEYFVDVHQLVFHQRFVSASIFIICIKYCNLIYLSIDHFIILKGHLMADWLFLVGCIWFIFVWHIVFLSIFRVEYRNFQGASHLPVVGWKYQIFKKDRI